MNAKKILAGCVAIVLAGFLGTRYAKNILHESAGTEPVQGQVAEMNPDLAPQAGAILTTDVTPVVIVRNNTRFTGHDGTALLPGDRLEVGSPGYAAIIWPHYGRTVLYDDTVVVLTKAFESTNRERFEAKISLESGAIWTKFQDVLSQGQIFQVRAGSVLIDAAGGSFGVNRLSGENVTIDVRSKAVRAVAVREETPSAQMRAGGFDELYAEVPISKEEQVSERAIQMSQTGEVSSATPKDTPFVQKGDAAFAEGELDLQPSDATLQPAL